MSALRSGELFAGVGGLGMAVDEVFGSSPAWFAEFDAAPSKVLAHRFPDVPNYGDVTKIDFRTVPHTQVRCGGFPCTDVSLAGRRAGLKDGTRSGLWSEYARSIAEDRPDWVVIENVRGLLSADAAGGGERCPWCVGDDADEPVLRALGAVLLDLSELGFDAEWTHLHASDVGAPHGRFRVFILAWPAENTRRSGSGGRAAGQASSGRDDAPVGSDPRGDGGRADRGLSLLPTTGTLDHVEKRTMHKGGNLTLNGAIVGVNPKDAERLGVDVSRLLPTPVAQPSGNTPEEHLRKKPGRTVVTDLAIMAENDLIASGGQLLPTPSVAMAEGGQTSRSGDRRGELLIGGIAEQCATNWGPYTAAVRRWEAVLGRPAPSPVRMDGKGGKARLNPELTEWMMGWPLGWVTDPAIGLTRAEQLKACGNGVVPQQAAHALRSLLARPGVPQLEAVAA